MPVARSLKLPFIAAASLAACLALAALFPLAQRLAVIASTPRSLLSWTPPALERVTMRIIPSSVHYALGAPAWHALLPRGGHVVHTSDISGDAPRTYTVALFHQLRCLEVLHDAYIDEGRHRTDDRVQHCMHYLRETLLCQMDIRNEPQGAVYTNNGFDTLCYDWEAIFTEAERNFDVYTTGLARK